MLDDVKKTLSKFNQLYKEENYSEVINAYIAIAKSKRSEALLASLSAEVSKWLVDTKSADLFLLQGYIRMDQEKFDTAITSFEQAIEVDPNYTDAYTYKGSIELWQKKYNEALASYKKASELDPNNASTWIGLGNSHFYLGKYSEAFNNYQKALEVDPENVEAIYDQALVDSQLNRQTDAVERFNKVIAIDPKFQDVWNARGSVYFDLGKYEDALSDYEKAIAFEPQHNHAHYNKGLALFKLGRNEEAMENFNKALEINPNYANAYFSKGELYRDSKEYEKAISNFKRYKELVTDDYNRNWADREINEIREESNDKDIRELQESIDAVKSVLQFDGEHVTHYTNLVGAKILMTDKNSSFRMSEANYMNDTTEGERLKNAVLPNNNFVSSNIIKHKEKPFLGSFVDQQKNNDLTLWRMYARTEGIDGKGCAITLKTHEFLQVIRDTFFTEESSTPRSSDVDLEEVSSQTEILSNKSLKKKKLALNKSEFSFFKVAYLNGNGKCIVNNKPDTTINGALIKIKASMKAISNKNDKELLETALSRLSEIEYLFKGAEYQHESEVRLILSKTGKSKNIKVDQSGVYPIPRVYLNIGNLIPAVHSVTVGPKVERPKEWASMFNYQFQEFGLSNVDVFISQLPYK